jgi:cell division protein FtsW
MITALLLCLGVLMVFSASISLTAENLERRFLQRHLFALAAGVAAAAAAAAVPAYRWRQCAIPFFLLNVILLVAVLVPGVGSKVRGAQRWLRWGSLSLQPAELAKIGLVLCLARLCAVRSFANLGWKRLLVVTPPLLLVAALTLAQPDFGTAVFLTLLAGIVVYLAGMPVRYLALAAAAAIPVVGVLLVAEPYRIQRVTGYVQTWSNPEEAPYHLRQSLITLGSGGLTGSGIGKGWQKLSYLPEANNDFVFSVVGEELGLIGTLTVLALWGALLVMGLRLVKAATHDPFAYLAASALLLGLVAQAVINVAVVTALLPPKGIPLPLVSYGGSSLLASLLAIGIVLGLTRQPAGQGRHPFAKSAMGST